jgi:hypothetical protein
MWFALPVSSFVVTLLLSIKGHIWKWVFPLISTLFGYAIPLILFRNVGAGGAPPIMFSLVPSLLGLGIGLLVHWLRKRHTAKNK